MTSLRRWLVVLAGLAILAALPAAVAALPARTVAVSATTLLQRINSSGNQAYSGYAESSGGLALPVTDQFGSIADLFGGRSQLRVWWRSDADWRVDAITFAGESDVHHDATGEWSWNYESNSVSRTDQPVAPAVRSPTAADLLPPQLARRLLSQASPSEASRIGSARIAGRTAAGLRITPNQPASTIASVDVWADPRTGVPLRVAVRAKQSSGAALSSTFLDFSSGRPAAGTTAFSPPTGATINSGPTGDLATAIDQLAGVTPPARLAGLDRNRLLPSVGSVASYGRGVTEFIAVPMPRRVAFSLQDQLTAATGRQTSENPRTTLTIGPLNLLLSTPDEPGNAWLLVGTVTSQTLARAADALPSHPGLR